MELLYRGTRDGMSADVFHNKYNNKGPTICLFKNERVFTIIRDVFWQSKIVYFFAVKLHLLEIKGK